MATILESEAAFNARALEHGLNRAQLLRLQNQGLNNLSKLAFALTTPGTVPTDDSLKVLLDDDPDAVATGQLSSIRRLMFDAQALSASQSKLRCQVQTQAAKQNLSRPKGHRESRPKGGWGWS